ncbi:CPBP family intramembrane glutamic endopeptidase [Roseospirillum parvum]|uniref:CAAX protease self-immunity n=1 Tax=Roseospirillum parvum TaxID=83401 RepID=A0A1G7W742_9PROT|nr:CPBP family intramembrane glutamic endopeptidase [Roseospirillum parvum]SDG67746.1 CAAX protease self-immunity [Roseospirillum parvum]
MSGSSPPSVPRPAAARLWLAVGLAFLLGKVLVPLGFSLLAGDGLRLDGMAVYGADWAGRVVLLAVLLARPEVRRLLRFSEGGWGRAVVATLGIGVVVPLVVIIFDFAWVVGRVDMWFSAFPPIVTWAPLSGGWLWFDLTVGLLLVALSEELVFRGLGPAALADRPAVLRVVVPTLLFVLIHWHRGLAGMVWVVPFGLLAALLALKPGRLPGLIAAHYLINLWVFLPARVDGSA